ncbi:glycosyltransferase family 2 protein [Propylenella binzhouense]|uniref:Glycosyltransferase family 2 protein n=1 Tax=Propylenella binzhouense TaxID=2555902 RepID=A0A964T5E0_9HYPH|nr:glycosyltransferase family 2 protein [Propylenella binzhouense]MYZ48841.1 glycosyltransferase family 2 protein [Propylenella binzhouense]
MPLPISIFIITRNEGDRLGRTLAAVRHLSDDIVVVDSGSTDDTVAVAARFGARVIRNDWVGYGPQKRFAEEQCRHDWLLNLDADEVVQPRLAGAIAALFSAGPPPLALYRIRIKTVYPGRTRPRPLADTIAPVRLYDRRRARYSPSLTDDRVVGGKLPSAVLPGAVWHYSFRSMDHIRDKLEGYAALQVHEKVPGRSTLFLRTRLLTELPAQFLRYYLFRRHVTGGRVGARYAFEHARAKRKRIERFLLALKATPAAEIRPPPRRVDESEPAD